MHKKIYKTGQIDNSMSIRENLPEDDLVNLIDKAESDISELISFYMENLERIEIERAGCMNDIEEWLRKGRISIGEYYRLKAHTEFFRDLEIAKFKNSMPQLKVIGCAKFNYEQEEGEEVEEYPIGGYDY